MRVVIIGAGIAGLAAAVDLAHAGVEVTLLERAASPGGKMRAVCIDGRPIDAGPTVFTLPEVFEGLFHDAGDSLSRHVRLFPAAVLARHVWQGGGQLDLFAELERSADAIGVLCGAADAAGFRRFAAQSRRIYETLDLTFMRSSRPSPLQLVRRVGVKNWPDMWNIQPFATLWQSTASYFRDPRLRQLFARYATYCGSSPFAAPATLMLIAHVEQAGVWYVQGGMHRLAVEIAALAARQGATIRYQAEVLKIEVQRGRIAGVQLAGGERIAADALISNADNNALASGAFGTAATRATAATALHARSLSAVTWNLLGRTSGFELAHHSVFFSADYRAEFDQIFSGRRLPASPTIYICAQDRLDSAPVRAGAGDGPAASDPRERLLCLINAPPVGDIHSFEPAEIDACTTRVFGLLQEFGLNISYAPSACVTSSPSDFERLFPTTGGALYGPASHGWAASFKRAGSRSAIPGLYLAGGSTHPGPGVPMAATSGRLAAACILADCASTRRSSRTATPGGTSMR